MSDHSAPFHERLAAAAEQTAPVCVGLDPHPARVAHLGPPVEAARTLCLAAIDAVAGTVAAVKPQSAFFEQHGAGGVAVLQEVVAAARDAGLLVVLDAKRGDIGSTAEAYAHAALDDDGPLGADAITLSPYLGPESLDPFLARCDRGKGVFVLVRTSNPGAAAWQVDVPVAERVAAWVDAESAARIGPSGLGPVGAVVAGNLSGGAARWRAAMPHAWLLVPGFGAQGGTADHVRALFRDDGLGALVTSSRAVLFPPSGAPETDPRPGIRARARDLARTIRAVASG